MTELDCVDDQYYDPSCSGDYREKGLITWTVRFKGRPKGPFDDGSVIVLVNLETGAVKVLGRPGAASEGASGEP